MFNPHPPLTGAPVTLLVLALLCELLALFPWGAGAQAHSEGTVAAEPSKVPARLRTAATSFLAAGICLTPITYYSGYWGAEAASQSFAISDELIAAHQGWGKFLLIVLFPTALLFALDRASAQPPIWVRISYLGLLLAAASLAVVTSYQGGMLVFGHGAGVFAPK